MIAEYLSNTFLLLTDSYFVYYQTPLPRAGWDSRSIFKSNKSGLNSEYSFLLHQLPNQVSRNLLWTAVLPVVVMWTERSMLFQGYLDEENTSSLFQNFNSAQGLHFLEDKNYCKTHLIFLLLKKKFHPI